MSERGLQLNGLPCIKELNGIKTLFVDNEPFLVLGGETHNSAGSDLAYMKKAVWPGIKELNLNTLIVPVYWENIEETEGTYNFTLVEGIIEQARVRGVHLILIWFGLWKNSKSDYVPGWMKKDTQRYRRVELANGEKLNSISPLCGLAVEKDAAALKKLMSFIKEMDQDKHTVIFIQVENEIGVLGSDRDYSDEANEKFRQEISKSLKEIYGMSGTWEECFEDDAGEYFMAYYYAKAVEIIAKAGAEEYPIPFYTNSWLAQYPWKKGSYPSGGPVPKVHKIWKNIAPSLFCLAPDIYVGYVPQVMEEYVAEENPLFIPEARKDAVTASYCLYAFAKYNAIGYSPFAIEEYGWNQEEIKKPSSELMKELNIDYTAFETEGAKDCLAVVYKLIENIKPLYFTYRGTSLWIPFVKKSEYEYGELLKFGKVDVLVSFSQKNSHKPIASGVILEVETNCFYIIGFMAKFEFVPKKCNGTKVDVIVFEEGRFEEGEWKSERRLNGDQKSKMQLGEMADCFYVEVYTY